MLRAFTIDDVELIYQLNSDPNVTRYTGDHVKNREEAREMLERSILPQYELYQHGRWAVIIKPELIFAGWCGLKTLPERAEVDLGYRLLPGFWGRGIATEAALACLNYGFDNQKISRIIGRAMPENAASWRVLEKIGMKYIGEELVDRHLARTYESLRPSVQ